LAVLVMVGSLVGAGISAEAKTLNFGLSGNPDSLDPHKTAGTLTFQTIKSIYDTLVEPDMSGKIVPALAEKWAVSADEKIWTFHLRKGVVFHNGDKLNSQDVKASFVRVLDKTVASPKPTNSQPSSRSTPPTSTRS
jgi:peptide/nickel transport system substrate-binding protein